MNIPTIRTATTADATLIADISRETFYDTYAEFNTRSDMDLFLSTTFKRETLMAEVGEPGNIFLLAFTDGEVAGYVFLKEYADPRLEEDAAIEVVRIYVRKPYIGKGIGRLLMDSAIKQAIALGKKIIWLCVWPKNQRAFQFYTTYGFEHYANRQFILGNDVQDDWAMKKRL